MNRRTDARPDHRPPAVGVWVVEILAVVVLGALLAVVFSASGARAATPQATAKITLHDPLKGTQITVTPMIRLDYSGDKHGQWHIQTTTGTHSGTLDRLHYSRIAPDQYRADIEYKAWVKSRVFAAGFER